MMDDLVITVITDSKLKGRMISFIHLYRYFAEQYLRAREKGLFIGRSLSELKLKTRSIPQQIYSVKEVDGEEKNKL